MEALQSRDVAEESVRALEKDREDLCAQIGRHEAELRNSKGALILAERRSEDLNTVLKGVKVRTRLRSGDDSHDWNVR